MLAETILNKAFSGTPSSLRRVSKVGTVPHRSPESNSMYSFMHNTCAGLKGKINDVGGVGFYENALLMTVRMTSSKYETFYSAIF